MLAFCKIGKYNWLFPFIIVSGEVGDVFLRQQSLLDKLVALSEYNQWFFDIGCTESYHSGAGSIYNAAIAEYNLGPS